jgi:hypothetical protein
MLQSPAELNNFPPQFICFCRTRDWLLDKAHSFVRSIGTCRLRRFLSVLRSFFYSSLLYTFPCHPSPPTIIPSSLTSSCHLFLGLPLNQPANLNLIKFKPCRTWHIVSRSIGGLVRVFLYYSDPQHVRGSNVLSNADSHVSIHMVSFPSRLEFSEDIAVYCCILLYIFPMYSQYIGYANYTWQCIIMEYLCQCSVCTYCSINWLNVLLTVHLNISA